VLQVAMMMYGQEPTLAEIRHMLRRSA